MNMFHFLKGKTGKVVFGAAQLAGTTLVGGLLAVSAWNMANPPVPAEDMPIRSFSQIARGSAHNEGINVSSGGVAFASAEERANLDGSSNSFGLDNEKYVDGLSASGSGTAGSVGSGYQMGGSEGLGMGANAATVTTGSRASGPGVDPAAGVTEGTVAAGAGPLGAAEGKAGAPILATASIARASGGGGAVTSSGYGSPRSGGANGGVAGSAGTRGGNGIGYTAPGTAISGAMPEGSTLVDANKFSRGAEGIGGGRGGRAAGGTQSKDGRDLAFIAKRSADAAGNRTRSANEGSRAFLASTQNSGGINTDGGSEEVSASASSEDFEAPRIAKERGLDNKTDDTWKTEMEKQQHRNRLKKNMLGLIFASIPAIFAIAALMKAGDVTFWAKFAAIALASVMTVAWGLFIADAFKYKNLYGESTWAWASLGAGAVFVAAMWSALFVPAVTKLINGAITWINGLFKGASIVGAAGAIGAVVEGGTSAVSSGKGLSNSGKGDSSLDLGKDGKTNGNARGQTR